MKLPANEHSCSENDLYWHIILLLLLLHPTPCSLEDPWKNFWLEEGILGKADIFNTSVCFTIPLFSFNFPSFSKEDTTCVSENKDESCLPQEPLYTSIFKQNILGQAIFFGVTAISVAASLAFPAFLKIQDEETMLQNMVKANLTNSKEDSLT